MPSGSNVTYTLDCIIEEGFVGLLSNTATLTGSVIDPTPGNEAATDTTGVAPAAQEVPAISTWGLILLIGFMGMIAMVMLRRESTNH